MLPSAKALSSRCKETNITGWEKLIFSDYGDANEIRKYLIDNHILPEPDAIYSKNTIHRFFENGHTNRLLLLINANICPPAHLLMLNFPNQWYNAWDRLNTWKYFDVITALFTNKIYPDTKRLIKIQFFLNELEKRLKAEKASSDDVVVVLIRNIKSQVEERLRKEDASIVNTIQKNLDLQFRHHLFSCSSNMMSALLSGHDNSYYNYLYLLYRMVTPDLTLKHSDLPFDILLKIGEYALPEPFNHSISTLLDKDNRSTFIKWHVIQGLENCPAPPSTWGFWSNKQDDPIEHFKYLSTSNVSSTIEDKYRDLRFSKKHHRFFNPQYSNKPVLGVLKDCILLSHSLDKVKKNQYRVTDGLKRKIGGQACSVPQAHCKHLPFSQLTLCIIEIFHLCIFPYFYILLFFPSI